MISELEEAEAAYQYWQEEIQFDPTSVNHEEAMEYYAVEEEKAEMLKKDMRQTLD